MDRLVHFKDPINDCGQTTWIFMYFHGPFLLYCGIFYRVEWIQKEGIPGSGHSEHLQQQTVANLRTLAALQRKHVLFWGGEGDLCSQAHELPWTLVHNLSIFTNVKQQQVFVNHKRHWQYDRTVYLNAKSLARKIFFGKIFLYVNCFPCFPVWCLTTVRVHGGSCPCVWLTLGSYIVMSCLELWVAWQESDVSNKMTLTSSALWTRHVTWATSHENECDMSLCQDGWRKSQPCDIAFIQQIVGTSV